MHTKDDSNEGGFTELPNLPVPGTGICSDSDPATSPDTTSPASTCGKVPATRDSHQTTDSSKAKVFRFLSSSELDSKKGTHF